MRDTDNESTLVPKPPGLHRDTRGLSSVEYLILLVVIAVACIGLWKKIGGHLVKHATDAEQKLDTI